MAKLFKRGRVWFARVPKRGGGTRRVSTLCTSQRAAAIALAQLEREAVDPAYAASNKVTVQQILDEYYKSRERLGRAAGTLHHVRVKAGALLGLLPERAVRLSHEVLLRYVDARLGEGAMRTTVKKELRVLKAALRLARRNKLFTLDPDDLIPELEDDYRPRKRALTTWELVALVQTLVEHDAPRAAHVVFIVATGARWGESLRARMEDVRRDEYGVPVAVELRGTKTAAAHRVVPLVGAAPSMVSWLWSRRSLGEPRLFRRWGNVVRDLAVACRHASIDPVTPNDLRRTFATWLRAGGVEPQLIAVAMGHTTSRMVETTYGRLTPDALGKLLSARLGDGTLMGHATAGSGHGATPPTTTGDSGQTVIQAHLSDPSVRRDRIELSTRGFSVRSSFPSEVQDNEGDSSGEDGPPGTTCVISGSPFVASVGSRPSPFSHRAGCACIGEHDACDCGADLAARALAAIHGPVPREAQIRGVLR